MLLTGRRVVVELIILQSGVIGAAEQRVCGIVQPQCGRTGCSQEFRTCVNRLKCQMQRPGFDDAL